MDRNRAKEILLLYRPWTADAADPEVAAALALVAEDRELALWLDQHRANQVAIRAGFRSIPVPDGLKQQILSERKAHFSLPLKKKIALALSAVALAVLVGSLGRLYFRTSRDESFAAYQVKMEGYVLRGVYPKMDLETSDQTRIRDYLAAHSGVAGYTLPNALAQTTSTGCKVLDWHGHKVSMVCFNSGKTGNPIDLFLFVVNRKDVQNPPESPLPEVAQSFGELATASWTDGDKSYLLGGLGDTRFLKNYLPQ